MSDKGITGGPFLNFKWGGMNLAPNGEPEIVFSGRDYETKLAGDESSYAESKTRIGKISMDVVMSMSEYKSLCAMQDGKPRAGVGTTANGDVIMINAAIEGEIPIKNGIVSLALTGKVRLQ